MVPMSPQVNQSLIGKTILVFSVNSEGYIGKAGKKIWSHEHDEERLKRLITGHTVVMGRKTFEGNGSRPIKDCVNIVLSTTLPKSTPGIFVARSIAEIEQCYQAHGRNLLYHIGGGSLFSQVIDKADVLLMTQAEDQTIGDVQLGFSIDQAKWKISSVLPYSRLKPEALKFQPVYDYLRSQFDNDLTLGWNSGTFDTWFHNRFLFMANAYRTLKEKNKRKQEIFNEIWRLWTATRGIPAPRRLPFNEGADVAANILLELYRLEEDGTKYDTFDLLRLRLMGLTELSEETVKIIHHAEALIDYELKAPENRERSHAYITVRRIGDEEAAIPDEVQPLAIEEEPKGEPGIQVEVS